VPLNENLLRVEVGVEGMPLFTGAVGIV